MRKGRRIQMEQSERKQAGLTQGVLSSLFVYEQYTGDLKYKFRTEEDLRHGKTSISDSYLEWWNQNRAGKTAILDRLKDGYCRVRVYNKTFQAHRVIWCIHSGQWPDIIDHKNRVKNDNRLINIHNVTEEENLLNQEGLLAGVRWIESTEQWEAYKRYYGFESVLRFKEFSDAILQARIWGSQL